MNAKLQSMQDAEKEYVSDEVAAKAIAYINNMAIKDAGDLLLYCSALNICNTYVKQDNSKIGYYFKRKVENILNAIEIFDMEDVFVDLQKDNGMSLLVVQVGEVQFSFHGIKITEEINMMLQRLNRKKTLMWDGVRKQHCSVTTFKLAEDNIYRKSSVTFRGKPLESKVERDAEKMLSGKIVFKVF